MSNDLLNQNTLRMADNIRSKSALQSRKTMRELEMENLRNPVTNSKRLDNQVAKENVVNDRAALLSKRLNSQIAKDNVMDNRVSMLSKRLNSQLAKEDVMDNRAALLSRRLNTQMVEEDVIDNRAALLSKRLNRQMAEEDVIDNRAALLSKRLNRQMTEEDVIDNRAALLSRRLNSQVAKEDLISNRKSLLSQPAIPNRLNSTQNNLVSKRVQFENLLKNRQQLLMKENEIENEIENENESVMPSVNFVDSDELIMKNSITIEPPVLKYNNQEPGNSWTLSFRIPGNVVIKHQFHKLEPFGSVVKQLQYDLNYSDGLVFILPPANIITCQLSTPIVQCQIGNYDTLTVTKA